MSEQLRNYAQSTIEECRNATDKSKYKTYVRAIALCLMLQPDWEKKLDAFLHKYVKVKARQTEKAQMSEEFRTIFWSSAWKAYAFISGDSKLKYSEFNLSILKYLFNKRIWECEIENARLRWLFNEDVYKEMTVLEFLCYCKNQSIQNDREDWFRKLKKHNIWFKSLSDFKKLIASIWLDENITNKEIEIFTKIFLSDEITTHDIADFKYY